MTDALYRTTWARALLVGAVALSTTLGAGLASNSQHTILALAVMALIAAFALSYPEVFAVVLVGALLMPYTWSPNVLGVPAPFILLLALPGAFAGGWVLIKRGGLRLSVIDYVVVAVFASLSLSEVLAGSGLTLGAHTLARTEINILLFPYVSFRLIIAAWPHLVEKVSTGFMAVGGTLSVMAILEELQHSTLFAVSTLNNPQLTQWARTYDRGGAIRAQATMGHPIALGTFLIIPLLLAFAYRRWHLFTLIALGEAFTLSRGPYLAAIVALMLFGALAKRLGKLWVLVTVIAVAALFVGPVRNSISASFQSGTAEQHNANYRSALLNTSLRSLTPWGNPTAKTNELYGHEGQFSLSDVTSEFALMAGRQGALGLLVWLGFLGAFGYAIREARRSSDLLLLALATALVAEWIALLSVSLITSFQYAFWLTVAMTAARLAERHQLTE